jgi:hypothetical protein
LYDPRSFEDPGLPAADPKTYLARLRMLGANGVFLRLGKSPVPAPCYSAEEFEPVARYEGDDVRSSVCRVR